MNKKIILTLTSTDIFFRELTPQIESISSFFNNENTPKIIHAIIATFKDLTKEQTGNLKEISWEHKENIYPDFHNLLTSRIDSALNRHIHTTSLERLTDVIEKHMLETANNQELTTLIEKEENTIVEPYKELEHITQYLKSTWSGLDEDSITLAWRQAVDKTKYIFDQYSFTDLAQTVKNEVIINDVLNSKHLNFQMLLGSMSLADNINKSWDYSKAVNSIMYELKAQNPEITKAKPLGWRELAKDYTDYKGMEEIDEEAIKKQFGGMDSNTAGTYSFELRVALPHVMYDDKCQGRKPLQTLVGAMVGHAYIMNQRNNSIYMKEELSELIEEINSTKESHIQFQFNEILNKAYFELMTDKEISEDNLKILGLDKPKNKKNKP